jgi:RNA-directed DNA polymerase
MSRLIKHIMDWDNLVVAWDQVEKARGAAGSDGVSVKRWGRTWEARLVALRRAVMGNTYQPAPLERFSVPKRGGGVRHMTNLTVTDKVLQRAVLNVLDDIFEGIFLDGSFGYRQGRSLGDAVRTIVKHRDMALEWVFDADVDDCFGSLDHGLIMPTTGSLCARPRTMLTAPGTTPCWCWRVSSCNWNRARPA